MTNNEVFYNMMNLGYLQDTVVTPLSQQEDVKLYDMADVWVKIQDVLQVRSCDKGCHLDSE